MSNQNSTLAGDVVAALQSLGIKRALFCGGARNAPFAPELQAAEITCTNFFEERSAAFFALGIARAVASPVAIFTTSGTAVAECLPAIIEAHYQGLPLIVVSADRPKRFRGSGAPQAIEQLGLFGSYVQFCADIEDSTQLEVLSSWSKTTPLHINVCLEEPSKEFAKQEQTQLILPNKPPQKNQEYWAQLGLTSAPKIAHEEELLTASLQLGSFVNPSQDGELLVLVGDLQPSDRPAVLDFLHRLQAPFWAEASSGVREETNLAPFRLEGGEVALSQGDWKKVLRIGSVPSCRFWRDLEEQFKVDVLSIHPSGYSGLGRGGEVLPFAPATLLSKCGVRRQGRAVEILRLDRKARADLEESMATHPYSELTWMERIASSIPNNSLVFLGNSLPIRNWNQAVGRKKRSWNVHASRGANGIDGQIATFLGLASRVARGNEAWCILGDLTTLYDINSLLLAEHLHPNLPVRIVAINNNGGAIFRTLSGLAKQKQALHLVENSHSYKLTPWATAAGWESHFCKQQMPQLASNRAFIEISPEREA